MNLQMQKKEETLLILGVILIALNLRPALTAIGPLASLIRTDLGLSGSEMGLLMTLPLVVFAFFSLGAPRWGRWLGNEIALFLGLLILAFGLWLRSVPLPSLLFVGTFFIGGGIALANVLLPALIKERFPQKVEVMTGLYTAVMVGSAALASGLSVPLALRFNWATALRFWLVLVLGALLIWLPQLNRGKPVGQKKKSALRSLGKQALAWQVTFFMGLQSFCFYVTIAWLPAILTGYGLSLTMAGWLLALLQFMNIPGAFLASLGAKQMADQRKIVLFLGLIYLLGFGGILWGPHLFVLLGAIIILGFGQGATVSLAFIFFVLRTVDSEQAAELSGMAQAVGYLLAALGPILVGYLFDLTQAWTIPLWLLIGASGLMTLVGWGAGRDSCLVSGEKGE